MERLFGLKSVKRRKSTGKSRSEQKPERKIVSCCLHRVESIKALFINFIGRKGNSWGGKNPRLADIQMVIFRETKKPGYRIPSKGKTHNGFRYSINQKKYLRVFLDDGAVPMDNHTALYNLFVASALARKTG